MHATQRVRECGRDVLGDEFPRRLAYAVSHASEALSQSPESGEDPRDIVGDGLSLSEGAESAEDPRHIVGDGLSLSEGAESAEDPRHCIRDRRALRRCPEPIEDPAREVGGCDYLGEE